MASLEPDGKRHPRWRKSYPGLFHLTRRFSMDTSPCPVHFPVAITDSTASLALCPRGGRSPPLPRMSKSRLQLPFLLYQINCGALSSSRNALPSPPLNRRQDPARCSCGRCRSATRDAQSCTRRPPPCIVECAGLATLPHTSEGPESRLSQRNGTWPCPSVRRYAISWPRIRSAASAQNRFVSAITAPPSSLLWPPSPPFPSSSLPLRAGFADTKPNDESTRRPFAGTPRMSAIAGSEALVRMTNVSIDPALVSPRSSVPASGNMRSSKRSFSAAAHAPFAMR